MQQYIKKNYFYIFHNILFIDLHFLKKKDIHTEKFRNLVKSNQIVITIFRLIRHKTEFRLVANVKA